MIAAGAVALLRWRRRDQEFVAVTPGVVPAPGQPRRVRRVRGGQEWKGPVAVAGVDGPLLIQGVGTIFGNFLSGALRNPSAAGGQTATMFIGIAFSEALGIFSFLVALLLMFAV